MAVRRRRLDTELVRRGLVRSLEDAQHAISVGRVTVAGAPTNKSERMVAPAEPIELVAPPARFVGRGGEKLDAALDRFGIDVAGNRAIDCGASTGGSTDCLLQRGAEEVVAIDVGYGQLHERLRHDPRVRVYERTNLRGIDPAHVGGPAPIVVADLSFISLRAVADDLLGLALPDADLIVLVKPQFEAERREADRGRGVISDPAIWRRVLRSVHDSFRARGAAIMGAMTSPIAGADGNVEFLLHLQNAPSPTAHPPEFEPLLARTVDDAIARHLV